MSDVFPSSAGRERQLPSPRGDSLADVLERVLDKGIVIAGDIRVELLDIELLTIRIRLLVSSADKAEELGMAWWRSDPFYTGQLPEQEAARDDADTATSDALRELVQATEDVSRRLAAIESRESPAAPARTDDDGSS